MGSAQSGRRGWHVQTEQDVCPGCGVVAYPGETFCVSCGVYMGWGLTGSNGVVDPGRTDPGSVTPTAEVAAPAPVGHPAAPVGYVTPAAESAAERTRVISGEVVLWTTLPDAPPAAAGPGSTGYPGGGANTAESIPHLLLCPGCREPNAETRTYCHPCGALLRPEPEPPERTRWQRIRQEYLERPEVWHWDRRLGVLAVALPLCMAAGMSIGGAAAAAQRAVPLVKDRFLSQYAVAPDTVSASSAAKGFEANLASDGVDNKAWAPKGTGQDAVGQYWTAQFNEPFRLTSLLIDNGASKTPGQFFESGRPTKITVTASTTDQGQVAKEIRLGGRPGPQRFDLGIDNVMSVHVRIESVHPGLKPNMPVAMAEIQFFSRQEA